MGSSNKLRFARGMSINSLADRQSGWAQADVWITDKGKPGGHWVASFHFILLAHPIGVAGVSVVAGSNPVVSITIPTYRFAEVTLFI